MNAAQVRVAGEVRILGSVLISGVIVDGRGQQAKRRRVLGPDPVGCERERQS